MAFKKYTAEDIAEKVKAVHGGIVQLDVSTYVNSYTKARFIDKDYGEWWADPRDVLSGQEHKARSLQNKRTTKEEILQRLSGRNDIIDCDVSGYVNQGSKIKFVDKDFGDFYSVVSYILSGGKHPKRKVVHRLPIGDVVKRIKEAHGDLIKIIPESYVAVCKKATFIDKDFGEFEKIVSSVLIGQGCKKRADFNKQNNSPCRKTIEDMRELAKTKGGICLSKDYKNNKTKLLWKCQFGHEFKQTPNDVVGGHWCSICSNSRPKTIDDANKLAALKGGTCCSSEIKNVDTNIAWKCERGHVWQAAYNTIKQGHWCPECNLFRRQALLLDVLRDLFFGVEIKTAVRCFPWLCGNGRLEIDIYIPSLKVAIEYDGEQHFRPVCFGGTSKKEAIRNFKLQVKRDRLKNKLIKNHIKTSGTDIRVFIRFNFKEDITKEYVEAKLRESGINF